jgi:hypothetical protein
VYQPPAGAAGSDAASNSLAITFYDFKVVEGVRLAQIWRFWRWSSKEGIYGKPIGEARVYNLDFVVPKAGAFTRPRNGRQM